MVRLLPSLLHSSLGVAFGFNPTMVRLLPQVPGMEVSPSEFQSHNGAIAAGSNSRPTVVKQRFQSHNGAIAAQKPAKRPPFCRHVSIPQWCDCCFHISILSSASYFWFQSHNGAIAAKAKFWVLGAE